MKKLLQKLTETIGPSGYEQAVRLVIEAEVRSMADEVRTDALGNLIVHKAAVHGPRAGMRIMLAAPMDEPGVIASHIDESGFVRFSPIGPLPKQYLPGSHVYFLNGVEGIIASTQPATDDRVPALDLMFIDVGASAREDCPVHPGDVAVFERSFHDRGERLTGRSLGSRLTALAAIEALRLLRSSPNDLYFVFTAQERMASRGALTSSYGIEPEIALMLSASPAQDAAGASLPGLALGKGPAITICDEYLLADPRVVSWIVHSAEKNHIPFQRAVSALDTTNFRKVPSSRLGVPTGALSIPVRYLGSPAEMLAMNDLIQEVKLLAALLRSPARLEP